MSPRHVTVPGRLTIIGDHTDYAGGRSLAIAIDLALRAEVTEAPVSVSSRGHGTWRCEDDDTELWHRQVRAVFDELCPSTGAITVSGDLPEGVGLSSSAAFFATVALAWGARGELWQLARLLQRCEARSGSEVGLLDQLTVLGARRDRALLIDFARELTTLIPVNATIGITVVDSGVPRQLANSQYAARRSDVRELESRYGALGDLSMSDLPALSGDVLGRRLRHVVSENGRVDAAVAGVRDGDLFALGELVNASHASLRDDFDVSLPEIDALIESLVSRRGVTGARLVGGGFGGSVLVVHEPDINLEIPQRHWRVHATDGALAVHP